MHRYRYSLASGLLFSILFLHSSLFYSQERNAFSHRTADSPPWSGYLYANDPDPGQLVKTYEEYYARHPFEKNSTTQDYKRFLRKLSRDLYTVHPGAMPFESFQEAEAQYLRSRQSTRNRSTAMWTSIGPWDWDHTAADRSYAPGAAHVYTVEQAVDDPDHLYAGTATSGIWKTIDRGLNWTICTPDIISGSVTALEIDPEDSGTVYAELMNSIYKSTNGGSTWNPTGDAGFQSISMDVKDIVTVPGNAQSLFAATSEGLFRTQDGGADWDLVHAGSFLEVEFHPFNTDTVYAVRVNGAVTEFFRSVNGGSVFTQFSTGWPTPDTGMGEEQKRTELAVSPDAPDRVYALATGVANGGSGLYGVYISEDAGETWTFTCCGPQPAGVPSPDNMNLMGWSDNGTDDGGQYYYDLAFEVSPYQADSVYVAGVNLWVSGDAGQSFVCPAKWSHPHKPNYVHADIHDIHYYSHTGEIWLACDGGIFRSTDDGANFERRMTGISGTDFWGFGAGFRDANVMLGGTYHNGTLLKDNNVYMNDWLCTDGGDNYRGFVHYARDRQVFSDYNIKSLSGDRTVNNATRGFQHKPNASYIIGRSSDLLQHPNYSDTWISGSGTQLWKTVDNGFQFESLYDFGQDIAAIDQCQSNPDYIYVTTFPDWWGTKQIFRSTDGGNTFTDITPSSGLLNGNIWVPYDIAVDGQDPLKIWIVRTSMYGGTNLSGHAVYTSADGGDSWLNITTPTLDGESFTNILHQYGTSGGVYIGTRRGVYYRNADMPDWELHSDGLPASTFSVRLLPDYRGGKLRNPSNRSVWEGQFYESGAPVAMASVAERVFRCTEDSITFADHSILEQTGATWYWEFEGGLPSASTDQNPRVKYNEPGVYSVFLKVESASGIDSVFYPEFIEIRNACGLDTIAGIAMQCNGNPDYTQTPALDITTNTFTVAAWVKPDGIQNDYSGIFMNDGTTAGFNFREGNNTLGYHWPGGAWWWDSNLIVEPDTWSYVAMVVTPTSIRLYVNGEEAIHNTLADPVSFTTCKIGSYKGWADRNFSGILDEVCVWDRALSRTEIREKKHLTKDPAIETGLVLYYQWNETDGSVVYDKASGLHGNLNGNAGRFHSLAPVASGVSELQTVNGIGPYSFPVPGIAMRFEDTSNPPVGELVVTRLFSLTDSIPSGQYPQPHHRWMLNYYGSLLKSAVDSLNIDDIGFISSHMDTTLAGITFLQREPHAEFNEWSENYPIDMDFTSGSPGQLRLMGDFPIAPDGQWLIMRDSFPFGFGDVHIATPTLLPSEVRGGESALIYFHGSDQGIKLPVLNNTAIEEMGQPQPGLLCAMDSSGAIVYFNASDWNRVNMASVFTSIVAGTPEQPGLSLQTTSGSSASILDIGSVEGGVLPSTFSVDSLVNIAFPIMGMLIYIEQENKLAYFNGDRWKRLKSEPTDLDVSLAPPVSLEGMAVGLEIKDPNAVLHLDHPTKALVLPGALIDHIIDPEKGLIVFDLKLRIPCIHNGERWLILQAE